MRRVLFLLLQVIYKLLKMEGGVKVSINYAKLEASDNTDAFAAEQADCQSDYAHETASTYCGTIIHGCFF